MSKDLWIFLSIWNGVGAFYWYYKYRNLVIMIADTKFLERALEYMKEWEND